VKDIQKFLALANYYQQFIKSFVAIAKLLYNMVKKIRSKIGQKSRRKCSKQKKVFKELKERFINKPVLVVPDLDKKMRMKVDTSDYMTGRVLSMECKDE